MQEITSSVQDQTKLYLRNHGRILVRERPVSCNNRLGNDTKAPYHV
jgi:hypothetical protein